MIYFFLINIVFESDLKQDYRMIIQDYLIVIQLYRKILQDYRIMYNDKMKG